MSSLHYRTSALDITLEFPAKHDPFTILDFTWRRMGNTLTPESAARFEQAWQLRKEHEAEALKARHRAAA